MGLLIDESFFPSIANVPIGIPRLRLQDRANQIDQS